MKVTIRTVALKAGVSVSTVSKILTGKYKKDNVRISKETVEKVKKIAKELNYTPNYAGRFLSTGKTYTIGVNIPKSKKRNFFLGHYYSQIIDSIEKEAVKNGYDILLINHDSVIEKFKSKRIDGLIIIEQWEWNEEIEFLIKENLPFIIVNNLIEDKYKIPSVNIDNEYAVSEIVKHFKNNNHRNLAYIGELTSSPQKEHSIRLKYFIENIKKENLQLNENLFLIGKIPNISNKIKEEDYDQLSGYYGMEYLFKNYSKQFTGVFCANDLVALGALNFLYKNKIMVPNDISIIGFDDLDFSKYLVNGLTTIRQPLNEMGEISFKMLLKIINKKFTLDEVFIKLKPKLIIRNTVANLNLV